MAIQALGPLLQTIHAATIADLTGFTGGRIGFVARIASLGRSYIAVTTATSTADGITYITGTGVDWQMIYGSSDPKWLTQATWFIDASAGSDENSGIDLAHPVKTADEIQRRWGVDPILPQSVTITVLPGTHDHIYLHATPLNSTCQLTVQSNPTALVTTTIGTFTTFTHGTYGSVNPEATIITAAGIADWTTYAVVGNRLRSNTKYSNLAKVNPAGGGTTTLRTQPWGVMGTTGSMLWSASNPANGDALVIEQLPLVHNLRVVYEGGALSTTVALIVRDLYVDQSFMVRRGIYIRVRVFGCVFGAACSPPEMSNNAESLQRFFACDIRTNVDTAYDFYGCLFFATVLTTSPNDSSVISNCLSQGGSAGFNNFNFNGKMFLTEVQIFDNTKAAGVIQTSPGCDIEISGGLSGINTGPGFILADNARIQYSSAPNLLTSTGGLGEITFKSFSTTYGVGAIKWSDVPSTGFQTGIWKGTGTLTNGLLTVTLSPALTAIFLAGSQIKYGYIAPGISAGVLSYDTVTTAGFRLVSTCLVDSVSTVWWEAVSIIRRTDKIMLSTNS